MLTATSLAPFLCPLGAQQFLLLFHVLGHLGDVPHALWRNDGDFARHGVRPCRTTGLLRRMKQKKEEKACPGNGKRLGTRVDVPKALDACKSICAAENHSFHAWI